MTLSIPRDRAGTFDPKLIAKYQRRFPEFDDKIIWMYARGMTVREIRGHLEEFYGIDVSPEWQNRPLDTIYPLVFSDAIRVKIRDEGFVRTKASTSRSASCPTAPRRSSVSGSSKRKRPSSGCES
jgi:putative transposase